MSFGCLCYIKFGDEMTNDTRINEQIYINCASTPWGGNLYEFTGEKKIESLVLQDVVYVGNSHKGFVW